MKTLELKLKEIDVREDAIEWAKGKTFKNAWNTCERGDWMLWLAKIMMDKPGWCDLRNLTLAKARCAKLVIHLMKDDRSRNAVEVAEQFGLGNATEEELKIAAADAAYAAADADVAAAAYVAAAAAAAAAYVAAAAAAADADVAAAAYVAAAAAADAAADAAAAAYVADAAAAVAAADAAAAEKENILKQCANICRETIKVGKF